MSAPVRLFGRFTPDPRRERSIKKIRLRVIARQVPAGAEIDITDVQLQPGRHITGWSLNTRDLGVEPVDGWQWRNGVVYGDNNLIVVADAPAASPTRWEASRANGNLRIGDFHMGHTELAWVDGHAHQASQGAGIAPHLTARADIDVPVRLEGRALLTVWFRGIAAADPNEPLPIDPDPIDPDAPMPEPPEDDLPPEEPPEPERPGDNDEGRPTDPDNDDQEPQP